MSDDDALLLVVGAPRSGTSWLGKILDSHPSVLYYHEPDSARRSLEIPTLAVPPFSSEDVDRARDYLQDLIRTRTIKVAGSLPIFPKSYLSGPALALQKALVFGFKVGERAPVLGKSLKGASVPQLGRRESVRLDVIKSINGLGRVGLWMSSNPGLRTILIVRHPCGHIASVIRGLRLGKFESSVPITEDMGVYELLAETPLAQERGLDIAAFEAMEPLERLAWNWAITNSMALEALAEKERGYVVRYEDLCSDPVEESRRLFEFAGLDWSTQSADFVSASTKFSGAERYYQVFRDPRKSAYKWRDELSKEEIDQVMSVASQLPAGALFTERDGAA